MGISGADIVRVKIAIALWDLHAIDVPDEVMDEWETVRDVVRSMVAHAETRPWEQPLTEAEALPKVRQLIADEWDIPPEQVTPGAPLFSDPLRLDGPVRFHW